MKEKLEQLKNELKEKKAEISQKDKIIGQLQDQIKAEHFGINRFGTDDSTIFILVFQQLFHLWPFLIFLHHRHQICKAIITLEVIV